MPTFGYNICCSIVSFIILSSLALSAPIKFYNKADLERRAITVVPSVSQDSPRIYTGTSLSEANPFPITSTSQESGKGTLIIVPIATSESRVFPTSLTSSNIPIAPTTLHKSDQGTVIVIPPTPTDSSRAYPGPTGIESLSGLEPLPTSTNTPTEPSYVPGPSGRGTVGLLTSCVFTLFICVWTAIHLNVYPRGSTLLQRFTHRLGWATLALFAPEVIVWRAISQWESARGVCTQHNKIRKETLNRVEIPIDSDTSKSSTFLAPAGFVRWVISLWEKETLKRQGNEITASQRDISAIPEINIKNVEPIVNEGLTRPPESTENGANVTPNEEGDANEEPRSNEGPTMPVSVSKFRFPWRKIFSKNDSGTTSCGNTSLPNSDSEDWSVEHGFFAVMGGFEVQVQKENVDGVIADYKWILDDGATITPETILILTKLNLMPPVSRLILESRSKSDQLGKALVCMQAGWTALQTIARRIAGLPVTLLELNTLAHIVCAVLMYYIWWKKPQNVNEPYKIPVGTNLATAMSCFHFRRMFTNDAQISETAPLLQKGPSIRQRIWSIRVRILNAINDGLKFLHLDKYFAIKLGEKKLESPEQQLDLPQKEIDLEVHGAPQWIWGYETKARLIKKASKPGEGLVMLLPGQMVEIEGIPFHLKIDANPIHLTKHDIDRLRFMARLQKLQQNPPIESLEAQRDSVSLSLMRKLYVSPRRHLIWRARNMSIPGNLELPIVRTIVLFALLGFLYGGIHATAWNSYFPTTIEKQLFRLSTMFVMCGGFVLWVSYYLEKVMSNYRNRHISMVVIVADFVGWLAMISMGVAILAFCVARVFLVVEAFISVRQLPLGAYSSVNWVYFLPHFGGN